MMSIGNRLSGDGFEAGQVEVVKAESHFARRQDNDFGNFDGQFHHLGRDDIHHRTATSGASQFQSCLGWKSWRLVTSAVILA